MDVQFWYRINAVLLKAPALVLTFTCFQGAGENGPGFCTLQVLSEIIKV